MEEPISLQLDWKFLFRGGNLKDFLLFKLWDFEDFENSPGKKLQGK